MTAPTAASAGRTAPARTAPARTAPAGPVRDAHPPLRRGPDGAPSDGAAAFLATLAEYEGCPVERLE
ncbi:MAG TPA: hypothetical protein VNU26_02705 [Mycobacteriales bacterium]|nr:hypothetical protein [Mycobacteriales bacterium]